MNARVGARLRTLADPHRGPAQVVLPHRPGVLASVLPLGVRRAEVDGRPAEKVDEERCSVVLGSEEFDRLRLEFELPDLDEALRGRCFPEALACGERPPLAHRLLVRCAATRLRRSAPFRRRRRGGFEVSLDLESGEVHGRFTVEAVSVLAEARGRFEDPPAGREAFVLHSLLARSPRWHVVPQAGEPPPADGIETVWVDFSKPEPKGAYDGRTDAHRLREVPHALSHLLLRASEGPLLLLNERSADLREVLLAKGTRGPVARARDALLERIAVGTWRVLLDEAARRLGPPEDGEGWAVLGENHWTARAIVTAAAATGEDPETLLEMLAGDGTGRLGLLFEVSEKLGKIARDAAAALAKEARAR